MPMLEWPASTSFSTEELLAYLEAHVTNEAGILSDYEAMADQSHAPYITYLLNVIAEDEERHHRFYEEWANSLRAHTEFREVGEAVPDARREPNPKEILRQVERMLAFEEADQKHLRELQKHIKDYRDVTVWPLLVRLMQFDTEKHIEILKFIQKHARETMRVYGD